MRFTRVFECVRLQMSTAFVLYSVIVVVTLGWLGVGTHKHHDCVTVLLLCKITPLLGEIKEALHPPE